MKKFIEQHMYILVLVICVVILTGCAAKPKTDKPDAMSVIKNAESLGKALGCIFGCPESSKNKSTQSK